MQHVKQKKQGRQPTMLRNYRDIQLADDFFFFWK